MKNLSLLSTIGMLWLALPGMAQSQWSNFTPQYQVEILAGPSMSLSYGKFIDDHKTFHDVNYANADISGKVKPVFFFVAGLQGRFIPYQEGTVSKLSASLGIVYAQRGFNHVYNFNADYNGADIDDKMEYAEKYTVNHITVPVVIRYGKKWFAELGLSVDHFISATRRQKLERKVSGSDAYDGGFETDETEKFKLDKDMFDNRGTGVIVGMGLAFSDRTSLRITNHLFGNAFNDNAAKLKSYNLQLELILNLFKLPAQ